MPLEIPEVPEAPPTNKLGVIASTVGPAGAIIALGVVIYAVRAGTMRYRRKHPPAAVLKITNNTFNLEGEAPEVVAWCASDGPAIVAEGLSRMGRNTPHELLSTEIQIRNELPTIPEPLLKRIIQWLKRRIV